jgi:PAS domain S-box-containing protein
VSALDPPMAGTAESPYRDDHRHAELIADSLGDGLCWVDDRGQVVDVSVRYAEMVGYTRDEVVGGFPPHPEATPEERAALVEVAAATIAGHVRRIELELSRGDGTRISVVAAGSAARGASGTEALITFRDASDRRHAEESIAFAERRLRTILAASDEAVWLGQASGETEWANPRLATLVGQHAENLVGRPLEDLVLPPLRGQVRSALAAARRDGTARRVQTVLAGPRDSDVAGTLRIQPITDAEGGVATAVATFATAAARVSAAGTRSQVDLADMIDGAVVAMDAEGRVRYWSEGARRLFGHTPVEAVGRYGAALLTPNATPVQLAARRGQLERTGSWQSEVIALRKDGTRVPVWVRSLKVDDDATSFETIDVAVDLSERKSNESRLEDARGYLGAVANSMADGLYALTADGRLGYMNPAAERMLGWTTAEVKGRVMHAVVHYQRPDGSALPIQECAPMRAGLSGKTIEVDEDTFTRKDGTLMPVAYTASPIRTATGKGGTVIVFRDISATKADKRQLEEELSELKWVERIRSALDSDRLLLFAQPIVDVATRSVVQHELLLRMLLDGDVIPPGEFLPHAESHGIINEIDRWVLQRAARLAAEGSVVQLNISARSIGEPLLLSEVDRVLSSTGADPRNLIFEITESALLGDERAARKFADAMNALGCRLALDDFGTGYGGLTYLKRLPVQYLKIDVEFVRDLLQETASQHVVAAVVDLARRFGLQTIAEGVEQLEALEMLQDLGVDYAQGYALGTPGPAGEVLGGRSQATPDPGTESYPEGARR